MTSPFFQNLNLNSHYGQALNDFLNTSFNEILSKEFRDFIPNSNFQEIDGHYVAHLSVPGYDKNDLEIKLEDKKLVVSNIETKSEGESVKPINGFMPKPFKRTFILPENANQDNIEAKYFQGILTLKIGKIAEQPKVEKKIVIE